jgi:uncharacterized protein (DUF2267 family)
MTQPYDVQFASEQYQAWLSALKDRAMLQSHNQSQAIFRAVLQALRRHMTMEQTLSFADALPPLPRGIFIERWRPADPVSLSCANDFLQEVIESLSPHIIPPESIVSDVFAVLAERSSRLGAERLQQQLPEQLKSLWPSRENALPLMHKRNEHA